MWVWVAEVNIRCSTLEAIHLVCLFALRQDLSLGQGLTNEGRLDGQYVPGTHFLPIIGFISTYYHIQICIWFQGETWVPMLVWQALCRLGILPLPMLLLTFKKFH